MAADDHNVFLKSWPKQPASLEHHFAGKEPCPVSISFTETPARVIVSTEPRKPLDVDMNMKVSADKVIPLCISICEPICARSDYSIGINIFDNPFAAIHIRGMTKLYNCREEPAHKPVCFGFDELETGTDFAEAFSLQGVTFSPLGERIRAATFGEPAGRVKLVFPREGLRAEFPQLVQDLRLTVNNYASPDLKVTLYGESEVINQVPVTIDNTVRTLTFSETGIKAFTITGGDNEAGLVEICYQVMS